ncbi:hypothetical protein BaRGS_00009643 [Batillaria attramentaria]|uniref:N-acetylgalactosaminide beta-1,3-galactosyltransferase n=1 Tax=Batillaria attramentaria TaxID=370345 RepID=A0ABD0LIS5_9CAEN
MASTAFTWKAILLLSYTQFLGHGPVISGEQSAAGSAQSNGLQLQDLVVVVLSQPNPFHVQRAEAFREHFDEQLQSTPENERTLLFFPHEKWPDLRGAWTVFPLIPKFAELFSENKWIIVCEEETRIDLSKMLQLFQQYDGIEEPFLGRGLQDKSATIIHHFAFFDDPSVFSYPDFSAGMALSTYLVKRFAEKLAEKSVDMGFSIDPKHEFAKYLLDNLGVRLSPLCQFCGGGEDNRLNKNCECATQQPLKFPDCGPPVAKDDLFVAVKTCSKFHQDRVPVVQSTWGRETELIEYYSDEENATIPTVDLGVPNTERGHCGKTQAIFERAVKTERISSREWLLVADDDTLINLDLLRYLLPCYNSDEPVAVGERYGYGVSSGRGYDYLTGGGGMLFNKAAVQLLAKEFRCPSNDSPDDMLLGMFFASRGIPVTHSPYFHQARPEDYSEDFLQNHIPVSFHKHWNTNPYDVYDRLKNAQQPRVPVYADAHEEL